MGRRWHVLEWHWSETWLAWLTLAGTTVLLWALWLALRQSRQAA